MTASSSRSLQAGTLSLDELREVVRETVRAGFAGSSVGKEIARLIEQIERRDSLAVDVVVQDGDMHVSGDLRTGARPAFGLLLVRGDLDVSGLFETSLDPDATVVVTGTLRAQRLISSGFLEVHGSVEVAREALWLDNDGCSEIYGDLRATIAYTKYHAVKVHGRIEASLVVGDHPRFGSPHPYAFLKETDDAHKHTLRRRFPAAALVIEGDPDDAEDEWCIDYVKSDVLGQMVRSGEPLLRD